MNADDFPRLPAVMTEDGTCWKVWCDHCDRFHMHGADLSHRVAHCFRPGSPYERCGYIPVLADEGTGPAAEARVKAAAKACAAAPQKRQKPDREPVPAAVYRCFDAGDVLLYIGVSKDFGARWRRHAAEKHWWPEVVRQAIDWHPDEASAYAAETAAISAESPRHNIAGTPNRKAR